MKQQVRIAKATREGHRRRVKALQWLLTHYFAAKCLAVKKITQNNGRHTPGVNGVVLKTPEDKARLVNSLKKRHYYLQPLRRIYIPKSNGNKRPSGIPTMPCTLTCVGNHGRPEQLWCSGLNAAQPMPWKDYLMASAEIRHLHGTRRVTSKDALIILVMNGY